MNSPSLLGGPGGNGVTVGVGGIGVLVGARVAVGAGGVGVWVAAAGRRPRIWTQGRYSL